MYAIQAACNNQHWYQQSASLHTFRPNQHNQRQKKKLLFFVSFHHHYKQQQHAQMTCTMRTPGVQLIAIVALLLTKFS